jgi:mRNA interferase RelE/StbE
MRWTVHLAESARADLRELPDRIRLQVFKKIATLEEDPFPHGCKKLNTPSELYRLRSGDYRIVYAVLRQSRIVDVIRARNRKHAYRGL